MRDLLQLEYDTDSKRFYALDGKDISNNIANIMTYSIRQPTIEFMSQIEGCAKFVEKLDKNRH